VQVLSKLFVVGEKERLVFLDRRAELSAELIALESWDRRAIEKVARIETVIPKVFIERTMHLIGT